MKLWRSRPIKSHRIRKWVLWHHLLLGVGISALVAVLYVAIHSSDVVFRLSMGTGYVGLELLAGALLLGPLKVLRNGPNPLSTDLRRDVEMWAALVSIIVIGWQVHFRGEAWKYFLRSQYSGDSGWTCLGLPTTPAWKRGLWPESVGTLQ